MIIIKHAHEDGTLIYGTNKGDGVYEIAKRYGFRYFPSIKMIGIRQSRDKVANRWRIEGLAKALREAGHEVEVEIDDQHRDRATVLTDQAERLEDRAERLEGRAERHASASEAYRARADQIAERFYMGQPIIVGHYSERGARADQRRIHQAMDRSCEEHAAAQYTAAQASVVGNAAARSARPDVTARRIKTAEAELRKIQKELDGYTTRHLDGRGQPIYVFEHEAATGGRRESLEARKAQLSDQLAYDRAALAEAVAAGRYTVHSRDTIKVGDHVHNGLSWKRVVKVNPTTVAVETGYSWTDKIKYTDIRRHRSAE